MDIQIIFERGTDPYLYRDALYFTQEQFDALTEEEIEAMKDQRYNSWYDLVTNPPPSEEVITVPLRQYVEVNGEQYEILTEVPSSGDKLIQLHNTWYKRV